MQTKKVQEKTPAANKSMLTYKGKNSNIKKHFYYQNSSMGLLQFLKCSRSKQ